MHPKHSLILCGDFNFPDVQWPLRNVPSALTEFRRTLELHALTQHVNQPTRGTAILDLVFTSSDVACTGVQVIPPLLSSSHQTQSDHDIVAATLCITVSSNPPSVQPRRYDYTHVDWPTFQLELDSRSWVSVWQAPDVSLCWNAFADTVLQTVNECVPKRKVFRNHGPRRLPWYTACIKAALDVRHAKWKAYKTCPSALTCAEFKKSRNAACSLIRNARRNYEERIATFAQGNIKVFFAYANHNRINTKSIAPLLQADGSRTESTSEIVELLNTYFSSVFTPTDSQQPSVNSTNTLKYTFDEGEVRRSLESLSVNKAAGPDGINNLVLQKNSMTLAPLLTKLFQLSLDTGQLPDAWREANVTPLHKSGRKDQQENYRPVSLTSCVCKIMERFVYDWITDYLDFICPLNATQHGFQRRKSCVTQLLEHYNTITSALENHRCADVIYLDFSKAFDKVSHSLLLNKLHARQLPLQLINWIQAFLTNRRQRVVIDGEASGWLPVTSGVPQGSVLGPLLFGIFIDDLDNILTNGTIIGKFADDTKLTQVFNFNPVDAAPATPATLHLQTSLNQVLQWCDTWKLPLNIKKCVVLHYGLHNPCADYSINGSLLPISACTRDLGVMMSNSGKFREHCEQLAAKARRLTGLMLRTFHSRQSNVILPVYKSLIRPLLEYATAIWSPHYRSDIKEIESVQEYVTRRIQGLSKFSYSARLSTLRLSTLENRRSYFDLVECHKMIHGSVRHAVNSYISVVLTPVATSIS